MARRVVTLEIDSNAVRLMEATEVKVIKWASLSLGPGMVEEGIVSDPQALSAAVRQLMVSSGIKSDEVIASIGGLYSANRILMVPNPPVGTTTSQAVLEAAKDAMPLATDNLYLSWQTLATSESGQQVLVLGIPKDVIDTEVQALKAAGVNPRILELKAMALARAVNKEQALILNIEPASFDIVMLVNGIPEIMRTIAWKHDDLGLEDSAEHLALSLELTVGFYNSNHPNTPLDPSTPLLITGHLSGDPALVEKVQARAGYHIESLSPPLECPVHLPVSQYAVNIGLALKGTAPSRNLGQGGYTPPEMNLLPEVYRPWKPSARQIYVTCFVIGAIALLFPLYQATSGAMGKTADLQEKYDTLNNKMQLRQIEIKNRTPMQEAITEYGTIVDMGGGFTEDINVISKEAETLGIKVQSITHEGRSITVVCQADSYATIEKYLQALEKSGRFSTPIPRPETGFPYITGGSIKLTPKTASKPPAEKPSK